MQATVSNKFLSVTAKTFGAELTSVLGTDGTQYLWQGDPTYWDGQSPVLFPYVARLYGGSYRMDGERYTMLIHGLAPYTEFVLTAHTAESMTFSMTDTEQSKENYPRAFCFSVTYTLDENTLRVLYTVENRDAKPMYCGLGGHPGFRVPLTEGRNFTDYRLRFSTPSVPTRIGFTDTCFRNGADTPFALENGTVLPLAHTLFDDDAIVLKDMPREVTLETEGDTHSVTVRYPQMPYLGLWHWPKTDAPYVCIEPWGSLPSSDGEDTVFEDRPDLIWIDSGKTYSNEWTATFMA